MSRCDVRFAGGSQVDGCGLEAGHDGPHVQGLLRWHDPPLITIGGEQPDPGVDSEYWVDGQVRLRGGIDA